MRVDKYSHRQMDVCFKITFLVFLMAKSLPYIISDYIRTFTWDKKLEMVVKSTGILGGQGNRHTHGVVASFPLFSRMRVLNV